jgi:serine/threonine-protein kinase OSR1/STK39
MSSIQHENLVRTYITLTSYHTIYIIMPLMNAGSLSQIISFKYPDGIKNEAIIATIMRDCLMAIKCLNDNHLFHRDIKAANILLSTDGTVRLGDYGVAAVIKKGGRDSFVGSICWMAPEVISREKEYNHKVS